MHPSKDGEHCQFKFTRRSTTVAFEEGRWMIQVAELMSASSHSPSADDPIRHSMADVSRASLLIRIADALLFVFFLLIAVFVALIDVQIILPSAVFPQFLLDLKAWYCELFDDYLMEEKPAFFVGAAWLIVLFQWPLAVANILGFIGKKSWYPTTCLLYGVSACSVSAPVLGHIVGSERTSNKMLFIHSSVLGPAFVAMLLGLIPRISSPLSVKTSKIKRA